jgi:hypothetical protein
VRYAREGRWRDASDPRRSARPDAILWKGVKSAISHFRVWASTKSLSKRPAVLRLTDIGCFASTTSRQQRQPLGCVMMMMMMMMCACVFSA